MVLPYTCGPADWLGRDGGLLIHLLIGWGGMGSSHTLADWLGAYVAPIGVKSGPHTFPSAGQEGVGQVDG